MYSHNHNQAYPELNYGSGSKWIKSLTQNRLSTFLGGHFENVNLSSVLFTHHADGANLVDLQVWSTPGLTKPSFHEAMKQEFKPAKKGDSFGPSWVGRYSILNLLLIYVSVCRQTTGGRSLSRFLPTGNIEFDPGCEAMILSTYGVPLQGITGGYGGDRRVEHIIPPQAVRDGHYAVVIESSCTRLLR
ncbi:hypothetical protein AZE42_10275 [Rhizopogon vesiculosus]|uniref:Alpha-mannosidase Ams1-like N-terminal domain-containing protein n=1 Tax=Rhizopogon vesiculosus TaxID=180088 RepID=A0A1J8PRE1_9AGAM|nr:hypothetical protein AZE42_10275 [Rhizopogon vesiculosus]